MEPSTTTTNVSASSTLYLLDTNILLHYCRESRVVRWLESLYSLEITVPVPIITVMVEGELRSMAQHSGWKEKKRTTMTRLLSTFRHVSVETPDVLAAYVQIDNYNIVSGKALDDNDVWLAATASATGATLLSTDNDFAHLAPQFLNFVYINPTLKVADP